MFENYFWGNKIFFQTGVSCYLYSWNDGENFIPRYGACQLHLSPGSLEYSRHFCHSYRVSKKFTFSSGFELITEHSIRIWNFILKIYIVTIESYRSIFYYEQTIHKKVPIRKIFKYYKFDKFFNQNESGAGFMKIP